MASLLTPEQDAFVRLNYPKLTRCELLVELNKQFDLDLRLSQLVSYVKNHKIHSGRSGRFQKGNIPSENARPAGPNRTSFPKGHRPHNWVPVGTRRPTTDGYLREKLAEPNVWEFVHKMVWEEHHGPIPKGHAVIFKDNDQKNCAPENLMLVSRAELAVINKMQLSQVEAEYKPTAQLLAQIKIQRSKRKEANHG